MLEDIFEDTFERLNFCYSKQRLKSEHRKFQIFLRRTPGLDTFGNPKKPEVDFQRKDSN